MKIGLIGATGFVGKAVLRELLDRNHDVTGISRHPERLGFRHPGLRSKAGDMLDEAQVILYMKGQDVVISAYNAGWNNPDIYEECLRGWKTIQSGIIKAGVKRFLVVGGAGSLEVAPGLQLLDTPEFPPQFKGGAQAAREYLEILKKDKELEWTYISPAIQLVPGARTGAYRTAIDNPVLNSEGKSVISVEDLAVAIADEVEKPTHTRQRFTVGY